MLWAWQAMRHVLDCWPFVEECQSGNKVRLVLDTAPELWSVQNAASLTERGEAMALVQEACVWSSDGDKVKNRVLSEVMPMNRLCGRPTFCSFPTWMCRSGMRSASPSFTPTTQHTFQACKRLQGTLCMAGKKSRPPPPSPSPMPSPQQQRRILAEKVNKRESRAVRTEIFSLVSLLLLMIRFFRSS